MLWTIAWQKATGAASTDQDTPLIADQTMPVDANSHPLFPFQMYGMWAWAGGATILRMRVSAPKFRSVARPLIRPLEGAIAPSARPQIAEWWRHPILYNQTEPIQLLNSDSASETVSAVTTFGDGNRNSTAGDLYTVRYTTVVTPTASVWTAAPSLVPDDGLPTGKYEVQGLDSWAATSLAARLIFLGAISPQFGANVRPGVLMPTTALVQSTRYFRFGYLGMFGQFINTAAPTVEFLQNTAVANPDVYLDIVKIA